jgi:hypothetical protein
MGEWMYRSTFSWPRHEMEVSGKLHALVILPRGKSPSIHWIGGWLGPEAGLDDVEKRKFLTLKCCSNKFKWLKSFNIPLQERQEHRIYILNWLTKFHMLWTNIYSQTSLQGPTLSGASAIPTSKICASTVVITACRKLLVSMMVGWHQMVCNVQTKFCQTQSAISHAEGRQQTQSMVTHKHTLFSQDKKVSYTSSEQYSPGSRSRIMSRACR